MALSGGEQALFDLAMRRGGTPITSSSVPKAARDRVNQALIEAGAATITRRADTINTGGTNTASVNTGGSSVTIPTQSPVNTTMQQDMVERQSPVGGAPRPVLPEPINPNLSEAEQRAIAARNQQIEQENAARLAAAKEASAAREARMLEQQRNTFPGGGGGTPGGGTSTSTRNVFNTFNTQVADDLNRGIRSLETQLGSLTNRYDSLSSNYQDLLAQFQELQSRRMAQPAVQTDTGSGTAISGGMGATMQPSQQTSLTPYTQLPAAGSLAQQMQFLRPSMLGTGPGSLQDPFSTDPFNVDPFTLNPYPGQQQ